MCLKNIFSKILHNLIREKGNLINANAIVRDEEWNKLKNLIGKGLSWFVITPTNYDYCKSLFNLNINKMMFSRILGKRLKYLKQKKEYVELSIFLSRNKKLLDNNTQEKEIKESMAYLKSFNITPKKFIPIGGIYDRHTITIAKKYGLIELCDFNLHISNPLLKIINLFGIKITFIRYLYDFFKNRDFISIFKLIFGEILDVKEKTLHVEGFIRDDVWNALKNNVIGKGYIWFIITPANYDYCKSYFNLKMDKVKFSNILKERINYLKKRNEEIQLHIHLSRRREFLDNNLQEQKFKEAMEFMDSLEIEPKRFVAGWWIYNRYTVKLAKKYGFNEISDYSINPFLKEMTIDGIKIKFVHKYWHDFDFI